MKYALLIILSFLTARETTTGQTLNVTTDSLAVAETTFFAEPPAEAGIPLDYEINDATVKGFITSLKDKFPVQLGAFRLKYNAEAFFNEVRNHIDRNAVMFREDGLYKIRISRDPVTEAADASGITKTDNNR